MRGSWSPIWMPVTLVALGRNSPRNSAGASGFRSQVSMVLRPPCRNRKISETSRVLRPRYAVMWAAFFNFIAFLLFGLHVAQTVGTGIVAAEVVDARVIFGALMGAISWNLITWWAGIPSSSSHALIGGLDGEWANASAGESYPSGNGTAGGDFSFRINLLGGDVSGDGQINALDLSFISSGSTARPSG